MQINVLKLSFTYENSYDSIFEDASFVIDTDWRLGLCGRNGRGKTTLLRLLKGDLAHNGAVSAEGIKFDYFPVEAEDKNAQTVDILYRLAPEAELWRILKELNKLDVDASVLYRSFCTLSNGEQTKVLLCGLFLKDNNFLLIDEPTNHLDMQSRQAVARYLKTKSGFILVSHDRALLDECVDHILSINKKGIEITKGNYSIWAENKERRDNFEINKNEKLKSEIERLKKAAGQKAGWAHRAEEKKKGAGDKGFMGAKAARQMKTAKIIEKRRDKAVEDKAQLLQNIEAVRGLKVEALEFYSKRLLTLSDICISYDKREILSGFNMIVEVGDRIALSGVNGSGKSSLIKLVLGENIPFSGGVDISSRLIVSYIPQDASDLAGSLRDYIEEQGIDETLFKNILSRLDFSKAQFDKDISDYSMGQKKKVLIAKSLSEKAHLYVWDEPLNYIDILSRIQIEELLLAYKPTMIFVEHDKAFCESIATRVVGLN